MAYASAAATASLYPTVADQVAAARAINASPAVVALYGPILDERSLGELAMTKMTVLYAVFVALLMVVVVRRHTRGDEENGRAELVAGTAVGRGAVLAAAVLEGVLLSLAVGVLAALADIAGGLPVAGSLAFGAAWVGIGWVSIGLTARGLPGLREQPHLFRHRRGRRSASSTRCAPSATSGPEWLSWLTPFGWSTRLRAWSDPRWWVLLLFLALGAALLAAAAVMRSRRDLGSGLLAARPGPAEGSPRLADALVLAWRVHRTAIWSWTVAVIVLGALMGAIAPSVGDLLDTEAGRAMIESLGGVGALQDALLAAVLSITAVLVTCFALTVIGHGATDEHDGRTEQVLATATSRSRSFLATCTIALRRGRLAAGRDRCGDRPRARRPGRRHRRRHGHHGRRGARPGARPSGSSWPWACCCTPSRAAGRCSAGRADGVLRGRPARRAAEAARRRDRALALHPRARDAGRTLHRRPALALTALAAALTALAWWRFRERDIG